MFDGELRIDKSEGIYFFHWKRYRGFKQGQFVVAAIIAGVGRNIPKGNDLKSEATK